MATVALSPPLSAAAPGSRRTSLKGRITRLARVGLAFQLVMVVLVVATSALVDQDGHHAATTRGTEVAASNLLAAMADQQTGLLTYLKPAQPDSLLLYTAGQVQTETSLAGLRTGTRGTADAGQEAVVEAAVRSWQRWADNLHGQQQPIDDPIVTAEGRHLFALFIAAQNQLVTRLDTESRQAGERIRSSTIASVGVVAGESLAFAVLLGVFSLRVVREVLTPLKQLVSAAEQVALEGLASIPYRDRRDEVGALARALQGWQEVSAVRTILAERAPVGICRIGAEGQIMVANPALDAILGYRRGDLVGRQFVTLLHPDDQARATRVREGLARGAAEAAEVEGRWLRADGSTVWCSIVTTPVMGADGRPETLVGIIQDITERKRQAERAAQIQRDLLPSERPELEGYELAAACMPMRDVAGDFYDWTGPEDGHIDLTVADVMSKGAGAALVMATLRMALRTMPRELNPRARVALAANSMMRLLTDDRLSLFHGRLDLASGVLHYVNAGHGFATVRRADGEMVALAARSLPVGAGDQEYTEGEVRLEPGDVLLVYTNGLVEVADGNVELRELLGVLKGAVTAEEVVGRLEVAVPGRQVDDATVVVLRRVAQLGPASAGIGAA
jgi:PAS domain S-box-containing protein